MCAIIGAVFRNLYDQESVNLANDYLNYMLYRSRERGRDGFGFSIITAEGVHTRKEINRYEKDIKGSNKQIKFFTKPVGAAVFICNLRAEPTTEYVANKRFEDQQPYEDGNWIIAHNGTIANDRQLREAAILHNLTNKDWKQVNTKIDSAAIVETLACNNHFADTVEMLKGSFAILAGNKGETDNLMFATNYRPIWIQQVDKFAVFLSSSENYFKIEPCSINERPTLIEPYSMGCVWWSPHRSKFHLNVESLRKARNSRALVVCSGGLDSVVAATIAKQELGYEIALMHFKYGSRAEGPEVKAVRDVSAALGGVPIIWMPLPIYGIEDSPLLQADSAIAGGEEGAEFAHEWVPARNLAMLSVATAYAEAHGYDTIVLGNNLEEAGAYPDNEPEFINQLNKVLNFAVGDGKHIRIMMPVGNLMKHEIVKKGLKLNAPLSLTWSCYRAGEKHCGKCGPCFMRKTAFEINNAKEVIEYEA